MKKLFSLLNLILCFELLVGPMMSTGGILTIQSAMAEDCPAGTSFDSTLNRCLTSEQTAQVMNAVANCNGSQACYKQTAEDALKKGVTDGKIEEELANKSGLFNTSMKAAAVAIPLTLTIKLLRGTNVKCAAPSIYAMLGGGVALFAGDLLSNMGHKSRIKKIKEEWEGILKTDTGSGTTTTTTSTTPKATEAQSQAFEMLAKSEDSMATAAKMKTGFFGAATVAFAASSVLAIMEVMAERAAAAAAPAGTVAGAAYTCPNTQTPETTTPDATDGGSIQNPASGRITVDPYHEQKSLRDQNFTFNLIREHNIQLKTGNENFQNLLDAKDLAAFMTLKEEMNLDPMLAQSISIDRYEYYSKEFKDTGLNKEESILPLMKKVIGIVYQNTNPFPEAHAGISDIAGMLNRQLMKPTTRAVISGVLAAWSATMTMHAMKQAKVSKNRAAFLRKIKTDFDDASTAIGSCTDAQRASPDSPNCYCYTAEGAHNSSRASSAVCTKLFTGKNVLPQETSYLASSSNVGTCFATNGSIDSTCACKATSTCLKATSSGLTGLATGSFSMLSSPLSTIDSLGNGTADAGTISGSASVANALRLLEARDKLAAKTKEGQAMLKNKAKIASQFASAANSAGAGMAPGFLGGSSGASSAMTPSEAAAELQKEFKQASAPINMANGGGAVAAPTPGTAEQFDFGMTTEQRTEQDTQIAEAMKQDLDYGQNDIKSSETNIFEAVSNRYQQSGMRRLFEDKKKVPEDKK